MKYLFLIVLAGAAAVALVALVRPLHRLHEVGAARRAHAARATRGHHARRLALEEQPRLQEKVAHMFVSVKFQFGATA